MDDDISIGGVVAGILGVVGVVVVIWLVVLFFSWLGARATPQPGEIGIVRSGPSKVWFGDWFKGHQIKEVVNPGSGSTSIGLGSSAHWYPADSVQRTYAITSDKTRGDRPGVDFTEVSTADGIRVGLNGTFYFTTAFNASPQGHASVRDFDNRFGVRTFPIARSGQQLHAYDGTDGWEAFLDNVIRPIIDNDLRQSIGNVSCAQLVPSCALVYHQSVKPVGKSSGSSEALLTQIQDAINQNLESDIARVLGKDYFSNIQFLMSGKPTLPGPIQFEIDKAQAQFAAVGSASAQVQQAKLQAQANKLRQAGYQNCPACASIDELKAIPSSVTTFAPGTGFAVTAPSAGK